MTTSSGGSNYSLSNGGGSSLLLTTVKWDVENDLFLSDLVQRCTLPHLALVTKGQYLSVGAPNVANPNLKPYLLVHSKHRIRKVLAQVVKVKEGKGQITLTDHKLSIPESYPGYFEILSEDGRPVRCLESVQELFQKFPELCLVRQNCKGIVPDSDGELRSLYRTRVIGEGEVLTLVGQFNFKRMSFLRCFDEQGRSIYLKMNQKAKFSPIAKSKDAIVGVHTIENLMTKRLPLTVKLVHQHQHNGTSSSSLPQEVSKLLSGSGGGHLVVRLLTTFREDTVFAYCVHKPDGQYLSVPINAHLKLAPAVNHPQLLNQNEFKDICRSCDHVMNTFFDRISTCNDHQLVYEQQQQQYPSNNCIVVVGDHTEPIPVNGSKNDLSSDGKNIYDECGPGRRIEVNGNDHVSIAPSICDDEIDQLYDYIRGLAPLPTGCDPIPQHAPQVNPQHVPQNAPHHFPQHVPQVNPQHAQQDTPHHFPHHVPQVNPQIIPQHAPQVIPQHAPHHFPQHVPQVNPQHIPQVNPQHAPQPVPQPVHHSRPKHNRSAPPPPPVETIPSWKSTNSFSSPEPRMTKSPPEPQRRDPVSPSSPTATNTSRGDRSKGDPPMRKPSLSPVPPEPRAKSPSTQFVIEVRMRNSSYRNDGNSRGSSRPVSNGHMLIVSDVPPAVPEKRLDEVIYGKDALDRLRRLSKSTEKIQGPVEEFYDNYGHTNGNYGVQLRGPLRGSPMNGHEMPRPMNGHEGPRPMNGHHEVPRPMNSHDRTPRHYYQNQPQKKNVPAGIPHQYARRMHSRPRPMSMVIPDSAQIMYSQPLFSSGAPMTHDYFPPPYGQTSSGDPYLHAYRSFINLTTLDDPPPPPPPPMYHHRENMAQHALRGATTSPPPPQQPPYYPPIYGANRQVYHRYAPRQYQPPYRV